MRTVQEARDEACRMARQRMVEAEEAMHSAPRGTDDYACIVAGILADRYEEARQNYLRVLRESRY